MVTDLLKREGFCWLAEMLVKIRKKGLFSSMRVHACVVSSHPMHHDKVS